MIRFTEFERLGIATAAFSEKSDGDLSLKGGDLARSRSARRDFCRSCGADETRLVCARQTHSAHVAWVTANDAGSGALDWNTGIDATDGLLTAELGLPIGVLVADCVPLFLFDSKRKVAGMVHAGRAGVRANIAAQAISALINTSNGSPGDLFALIGPSAGPCCYEVSQELADDFAHAGLPVHGRYLDLWEANALQLAGCGVPRENITVSHHCTICSERFHSFRGGDTTARNLALLML